eukprot:COSAG02_NODE_9847_length_2094_cov_2.584962_1_plen_113_part_10
MAFAETRYRNGAKCNPESYRPPMWSAQLFGEPYGEWTDPKEYRKLPGMCKVWDNENVSNGRVVQIEMAIRKLVDMRKEPSEMEEEQVKSMKTYICVLATLMLFSFLVIFGLVY